MKIILDTDLWLFEEGGETHASPPWIINMKTGEGCPGICSEPIRVLHRGTVVELSVARMTSVPPRP